MQSPLEQAANQFMTFRDSELSVRSDNPCEIQTS
jgi:hypothetical protein